MIPADIDRTNPYIQALLRAQASGTYTTTPDSSLSQYGLDNVNCEKCGNTGQITYRENGILYARKCSCMRKRVALRNIKLSGLADMMERYTFDNYIADDAQRKSIKRKAMDYVSADSGWLFVCGQSGSGKTHICTAVCKGLIDRELMVRYVLWRDTTVELKSLVTDSEQYEEKINKLKNADVLYIDDFLKGKVTEADINLAYEIINYRYVAGKRTIISCEIGIEDIINYDEALGGRIYEMSRQYCIKSPSENWRLR